MRRGIKYLYYIYLTVILGICLIPLIAAGAREDSGGKEDRTLVAIPPVYGQGGLNWNYLGEVGKYFENHFAFRQELITMDSVVRTGIFGVSPVSDVIAGKNGWLYYTATLDDFQHNSAVSDRMLFNIAHNVSLMQQYTESLGKKFLFTVAPNKNSLYGENMPERYSYHIEEKSVMERLKPWLEAEQVQYADLFGLFSSQDEILYYKRDSHWNQKGALLVYNTLLDACGREHETYHDSMMLLTYDYYGDLNRMLFPIGGKPEMYTEYIGSSVWTYRQGEDVEDTIVVTECGQGSQKLLMYRDSFGNSLIPLMAGEFSQAVFSRKVPYTMTDLVTYAPDFVILEKVERHLQTLGRIAPVMSAPEVELGDCQTAADNSTQLHVSKEGSYLKVSGTVDTQYTSVDSRIFAEIEDAAGSRIYEAFCIGAGEEGNVSDYGYVLYISEVLLEGDLRGINILTETQGQTFLRNAM